MKKHFLHRKEDLFEIPKSKLIAGILIGLGYAISFYSFLYVFREVFRIFTAPWTYSLWVLSDSEVNFYNVFFAFISVIFGQSICFTFWFNKPKKLFGRRYLRQINIVNDQRVFTWYFLSWFSKLALAFGIMFGATIGDFHYAFSFYPDYNYLFILIIVVLYFSSWSNIRLTFKRKSLKWLLTSMILVAALSFGLSRINVIDYRTLNEKYLENDIFYKYTLELPESDFYQKHEKRSLVEDIYIVKKKNEPENTKPTVVINNAEIALKDIERTIFELSSKRHEAERNYITYQFFIHKDIRMNFINELKAEVSKVGVKRIAYAVVPENPEFDQRYYGNLAFFTRLFNYFSDSTSYMKLYNEVSGFSNQIEIKGLNNNECLVNGSPIKFSQLKETLFNQISKDTNFVIKIDMGVEDSFSSYLNILNSSYKSIREIRNLYALSKFRREFDLLDTEKMRMVAKKYPFRIFEINEDFLK